MKKNGLNNEHDKIVEYDEWNINRISNNLLEVVPMETGRIEVSTKIKFCERFAKQQQCDLRFKIFSTRNLDDLDAVLTQQNYRKTHPQLLMRCDELELLLSRNETTIIKILESTDKDFFNQRNLLGLQDVEIGHDESIFRLIKDNEIIGSAFSTLTDNKMGIFNVKILEDFRRKGYGEHLLRAMFHWGRVQGAITTYLNVDKKNKAAIALYQKIGFVIESEIWIREKNM